LSKYLDRLFIGFLIFSKKDADTGELGALQAAGYQEEIAENKKTESLDKLPAPQETSNPIVNKGMHELPFSLAF
jgi:hypothetical protein